jgi:hypothetical protein
MTSPTIEIDLANILERIEQNIADFRQEFADFRKETNQRFTSLEIGQARLEERLTGEIKALNERLTGEIRTVDAKLDGLGKRLDTQEFINRSVMVGLVLAIAAGIVKLFFPNFPGNP